MNILNIFKSKDPKKLWKDSTTLIVPACELGGVQYYQPKSVMELPIGRASYFNLYFEEFRMRCDRELVEAHCKAINNVCSRMEAFFTLDNGSKIPFDKIFKELQHIKNLNGQLEERLTYIIDPDHVLKIASVLLWDANEHPTKYDVAYNQEKIAMWKKKMYHLEILALPIMQLIPSIEDVSGSFQMFSEAMQEINKYNWAEVSKQLSENERSSYEKNILPLQAMTIQ